MKNYYLVIPTIRDLSFLSVWGTAFQDCHLVIIEDGPQTSVTVPHRHFKSISHFCWTDIHHDFGKNEWIFSRHNAGIRSYGFWKAWKAGADIIITLDDDCFPVGNPATFVSDHINNLSLRAPKKWFTTYPDPKWMYTRGFPYEIREQFSVMVSHGLWSGALDLDGKTEVLLHRLLSEKPYPPIRQFIPSGYYYPMCSMNLAFRREVAPFMFFPMMGFDPLGHDWMYDRYDDIWAGIISKKIMDHLGWAVVNGSPMVDHRKRSFPKENYKKESSGLMVNELLWQEIDRVQLFSTSPIENYKYLVESMNLPKFRYFEKLREAMLIWIKLFT